MRLLQPKNTDIHAYPYRNRTITSMKNISLTLASIMLLSSYASADSLALNEEALFADLPIVLTATRLKQPKTKLPTSVTVIDRKMIDASGATRLPDLFRLVPGYIVARPLGGTFAVTPHGPTSADPRRLEVQVNGRSVYLPAQSSVSWSVIGVTLDEIERIEVVRGPSSPVHGSNAFQGVINIITREPFLDSGTTVTATHGESAFSSETFSHADSFGDLDYRLSVSHIADEGFEAPDDGHEIMTVSFRGNYQPSVTDNVDIQLVYSGGPEGLGGTGADANPYRDRDILSHSEHLSWSRSLPNGEELSITAYHNFHTENDLYNIGLLSEALSSSLPYPATTIATLIPSYFGGQTDQNIYHGVYNYTTERYDIEFENILNPTDNTRLVWGAGLRHDRLNGKYLLTDKGTIEDTSERLFGNLEWTASPSMVINAGAMLEHSKTAGTLFSPRFAANYIFDSGHALRASLTRGFRTLSILEANFNYHVQFADGTKLNALIISPDDLKPEKLTQFEIGYLGEILDKQLSYDIKLFAQKIQDGINQSADSTYVDPWPIYQNGARVLSSNSEVDLKGLEFQLRWEPDPKTLVFFQYARTDVEAWAINADSSIDRTLDDGVPNETAALLLSRTFDNQIQASTAIYYMDNMEWIGGDAIDGFTRIDFKVAKKLRMGSNDAEIAFIAHNLFSDYKEFESKNHFDEEYLIQAKINFD